MVKDLRLDFVNTHLPLRERIRLALGVQAKKQSQAAALAAATPEQLKEINSALGILQHLTGNRVKYAERCAELPELKASHLNSLASLGNQIEDAQERYAAASRAVFGTDPEPPQDAIVEVMLRAYLESKGQAYDAGR